MILVRMVLTSRDRKSAPWHRQAARRWRDYESASCTHDPHDASAKSVRRRTSRRREPTVSEGTRFGTDEGFHAAEVHNLARRKDP
jgi:hypothetical protein